MNVVNVLAYLIFNVQSKPGQPHISIIANEKSIDNSNHNLYTENILIRKVINGKR